ncbi:MAG: TonB-dependent receptor [Bacteroidetes bacterium]|nr:TonB-dependent receptor [Bacteroidota bacterium]
MLFIVLLASRVALRGQCAIQGKLSDTLHVPVSFNPIGLLNYSDSSIVKGVMTDADGNYCIDAIKKGSYCLKISALGFTTYYSDKIDYDSTHSISLATILLQKGGINLNEVSVAAQKKAVEFKNGNIIVNVEGTALSMGNTAYDLLSRLPGVSVSDGNISIQGKSGVKILIDGKLQQLSGAQLINVLKSMNASQIEKIEVLKKPPVKYDAAGTGGMINIKTKKIKLVGFSGNVFADYSQGFYGNPTGGFSLNYKGRKMNFFSGFSANRAWYQHQSDFKNYITYDSTETVLHQDFISKESGNFETYNLGADWFINKSNSIGIKMNGAFGFGNEERTATTSISDNSLGYSALQYNSKKPNPWIYPEFNINAEHFFDTTGTALRFSTDYNPYWDIYNAGFDNHFLDNQNNDIVNPTVFTTSNTLYFTNTSALLDFEKEFKKEFKLETGIKHSYQEMLSDYNLQNQNYVTGEYSIDPNFTNVYDYKQNISAGYINLSKSYKKLSFQMGVRGENTIINTISKSNGSGFNRQYFNLFPLVSLDYKKSDNHAFSISYNKRVNRPDYNSFNPFRIFRSVLSSDQGNPYLKPEYSHDISFTYSYKTWMNHSINFSRIYNTFMNYSTQNDSSKTTLNTQANLKWADVYSYSLFIQKDLFKWWSVNLNATVFHINANGMINNQLYTISTVAFMPDLFSRITLSKGYSIEINAFYLSPFLEGVYYTKSRSNVSVAFKKTFLEDKLSIALAFKDIFLGQIRNTTTNYQNQHSIGRQTFDTRRVNISVNYNFGKLKVQQRQIKDTEPKAKSGK